MRASASLQSLTLPAPPHTAADELAILDGWAGRVTHFLPHLAPLIEAPLGRLRVHAASLRSHSPVLCHRDLHEGQILLHAGRAGLLDFDTLRLGDPALDAGNLQAHLILASLRDGQSRAAFVTAIDFHLRHLPSSHIAWWRRAAVLRLALIYAFSAEPRGLIHALVAEAG
jgi:aminoglycoside phosphotransferase (APT) family kinase protein